METAQLSLRLAGEPIRERSCPRPSMSHRSANVYFLTRIGESLRWATSDIAQEELPESVILLLRRLDRQERRQNATKRRPDNDATR